MRGGAFSGLLKVHFVFPIMLLLLLFESHDSEVSTTRAEAVANNINSNTGDDPVASHQSSHHYRHHHRKLENRPTTEVIPDAYIILLNDDDNDVTVTPETIAQEYGITIEHIYQHAMKGFSSRYVDAAILDLLLEDSRIWAVGENGNLQVLEQQQQQHDDDDHEPHHDNEDVQGQENTDIGSDDMVHMQQAAVPAPVYLDQIDESMDSMYSYVYTGAGVHIYIVDAGILASHEDFGGRVVSPCWDDIGPCNTDTDSHGTHIASTAGTLLWSILIPYHCFFMICSNYCLAL
jgi:subtilisin family serine protease